MYIFIHFLVGNKEKNYITANNCGAHLYTNHRSKNLIRLVLIL